MPKIQPPARAAARRSMLAAGAATLAAAALPQRARAQAWPARPIRILNGFPAGGPSDLLARIVAERLQESLGQPVVVENRPGATGSIASQAVAQSAPDGYTLMVVPSSTHSVSPNITRVPWDPQKDFTPIAMIGNVTTVLAVTPSLPARTVAEFVAHARANPGRLNYGTPGRGSNLHLGMEMLKQMAGIDVVHVPYKGVTQAQADLMTGQIQVMLDNIVSVLPHMQAGRIRVLAVSSPKRSAALPELPTVAESGYPGFQVNAWAALLGPAGLPREVVERLHAETMKAVGRDDVRARFATLGVEPMPLSPAEAGEFMRAERERWAKVIRDANLTFE
jgi:tripartite-type tricarboxylate transporter receptor subunit TctC